MPAVDTDYLLSVCIPPSRFFYLKRYLRWACILAAVAGGVAATLTLSRLLISSFF